jgi:predicted aminopeptidase
MLPQDLAPKLLGFLLLVQLWGCYPVRQAYYQNNLYNGRRKVAELKADPKSDPILVDKLTELERVLDFATLHGLTVEENYRYYIDIGTKPVSYLVKAAEPLAFRFKTWWFPFVGTVPYLGFFSERERDEKAHELAGEGLDLHLTTAAAFSGLGWFEDPIYSSMLKRTPAGLAHLLFHELTHRTFWATDRAEFNENLAEFVADLLLERYLMETGREEEYQLFLARKREEVLFMTWIRDLKAALDRVYKENLSPARKSLEKERTLSLFLSLEKRPKFSGSWDPVASYTWNNATIMSFGMYGMNVETIGKAYRCLGRELLDFLSALTDLQQNEPAALEDLEEAFCG